jgi:hypothetical protein
VLYDKDDRMTRSAFCEEYDWRLDSEKKMRTSGDPWPPHVVLGRRIFYSRMRCEQWFAEQDAKSRADASR